MVRLHRSLVKRAKKIDVDKTAFAGEEHARMLASYKKFLTGVTGLYSDKRLKAKVKRIDAFEKEVIKLEDKIEALLEKRAFEAVELEEMMDSNLDILSEVLEPDEMRDFI